MDTTSLILGLLFGCVGSGYIMYGKSMSQMVPVGSGLGLIVVPFFISNNWILCGTCVVLMAIPFVLRDRV